MGKIFWSSMLGFTLTPTQIPNPTKKFHDKNMEKKPVLGQDIHIKVPVFNFNSENNNTYPPSSMSEWI